MLKIASGCSYVQCNYCILMAHLIQFKYLCLLTCDSFNKEHFRWRYGPEHRVIKERHSITTVYLSALAWTYLLDGYWETPSIIFIRVTFGFRESVKMCLHFFICLSLPANRLSPRCYLISKHCLFSWSVNYPFQHLTHYLQFITFFLSSFGSQKVKCIKCWFQRSNCCLDIWYSFTCQSPIKASIISLTSSREQRGCEITASEQLNTCQSDLQWQATLRLPTLITQINIKLNTRPCSVNFYVVKNDWLFASLHQRDQSTWEGYKSTGVPIEKPALFLLPYIIACVPFQYLKPLWTYHAQYCVMCS